MLKTNGLTIEHWPNFIPKPVGIQGLPWFPEKWSFEKTAHAQWSCDQGPDGGGCGAPLAAVWELVRIQTLEFHQLSGSVHCS